MSRSPRLSVRALIVEQGRLLLVNAYPGRTDLWCAPGGGVSAGEALPEALKRELAEECGLTVTPEEIALVNEFHDPASGFHQVDIFFRCALTGPRPEGAWQDPEGVVTERRWVSPFEAKALRFKPDRLFEAAFGLSAALYDPLERMLP